MQPFFVIFFNYNNYLVCHSFCTECNTNDRLCTKCIVNPGIIHDDVYNQCNCQTNSGYFIRKDSNNLDECVACHPLCKKCHGTTFNDCDECWADINLIDTLKGSTCNCIVGYFYDSTKLTKADYCQPCHEFCKDCITMFKYCTKCNDIPGVHFDNYNCLCGGSVLPLSEYFVVVNTTLHKDTCVKMPSNMHYLLWTIS